VFFRDPVKRKWHTLIWEHANMINGPMSEEVLKFERQLAKARNRYVDDPLAIANFLERRKLSLGNTMAERRMALRMSREQSSLINDLDADPTHTDLPVLTEALNRQPGERRPEPGAESGFVDDLDEDHENTIVVGENFYDNVLEVL
jgi:hypothetical protein